MSILVFSLIAISGAKIEDKVYSPLGTGLNEINKEESKKTFSTNVGHSSTSKVIRTSINEYSYSFGNSSHQCLYPGWYQTRTTLNIGKSCKSGACASGTDMNSKTFNLYFCKGPKDIGKKAKIPSSWSSNDLTLYCNSGGNINQEKYNLDFLTSQINTYRICVLKNEDLEENNTIVYGYEIGNPVVEAEKLKYGFNVSNPEQSTLLNDDIKHNSTVKSPLKGRAITIRDKEGGFDYTVPLWGEYQFPSLNPTDKGTDFGTTCGSTGTGTGSTGTGSSTGTGTSGSTTSGTLYEFGSEDEEFGKINDVNCDEGNTEGSCSSSPDSSICVANSHEAESGYLYDSDGNKATNPEIKADVVEKDGKNVYEVYYQMKKLTYNDTESGGHYFLHYAPSSGFFMFTNHNDFSNSKNLTDVFDKTFTHYNTGKRKISRVLMARYLSTNDEEVWGYEKAKTLLSGGGIYPIYYVHTDNNIGMTEDKCKSMLGMFDPKNTQPVNEPVTCTNNRVTINSKLMAQDYGNNELPSPKATGLFKNLILGVK